MGSTVIGPSGLQDAIQAVHDISAGHPILSQGQFEPVGGACTGLQELQTLQCMMRCHASCTLQVQEVLQEPPTQLPEAAVSLLCTQLEKQHRVTEFAFENLVGLCTNHGHSCRACYFKLSAQQY